MSKRITYKASESVLFQKLGEEAVLLDMESSKYFGLTRVAARIWELLMGGQTLVEIVSLIAQENNVAIERVRHDLLNFVDTLTSRGLLVQSV